MRSVWCWGVALLLAAGCAWGNVRLPQLFTDNMMLQREKPIPVWGWAEPGEAVTVTLAGAHVQATADADGTWQVQLPAMKEGEGLELTVAGKNALTLKNLILGDIWVCSGQSNMEMSVGSCNSPDDTKSADFPRIRRFKVNHTPSGRAEADFPRTAGHGPWQVCTPQTVNGFTAAGYFFAREVYQQTGVPIGLVDDNWGGTAIEAWLAPSTLGAVPELAKLKDGYDAQIDAYRKQMPVQINAAEAWVKQARAALEAGKDVPPMPDLVRHPIWAPGDGVKAYSLFNGMISPVLRLPIKGALWYQGEANGSDDDIYYHKMRALIGGWRTLWNQPELPFYFVQLANWLQPNDVPAGGDGWAKIRCAQTRAMLNIPHTGMATIIEIGDANDIHPKNKQDVGMRLALWALKNEYGKQGIVTSGPIYKGMTVEGAKIRLAFDYIGAGLMVGKKVGRTPAVEDPAGKLARFAIAGEDKKWVWADAVIDGNTVVVSNPQVPNPVAVRYAFSMNPTGANLYNKDGLPASPFRTDSW